MKFITAYSKRERYINSPGTASQPVFVRSVDEKGRPALIQDHIENIYEAVQLQAKGCSVSDIIARAKRGDTSQLLDPSTLSFGDITGAPKSLLEASVALAKARQTFDGLPLNVRESMNNSFEVFLARVNDGSFVKDSLDRTADKVRLDLSKVKSDDIPENVKNYIKEALNNGK